MSTNGETVNGEENWNAELETEVSVTDPQSLVVFSRDWTVETIVRQMERGNIDLNPKFQRRNAWNDEKRSKLIESLLIRVPIPEIVLAEDRSRKGSFIVIDGKQRLLAVAGFLEPNKFPFWDAPRLRSLKTRSDLNGKTFNDLGPIEKESEDQRTFRNADIRCTVISSYKDVGVLYDIFYRLNAGSVPLSSQELRQVLNRGPFADFIIEKTNTLIPLHKVLRLDEPDARLRDAEILLRFIATTLLGKTYDGNLTPFLDRVMGDINSKWDEMSARVASLYDDFNNGTQLLIDIFTEKRVGRKYNINGWEPRFNRALFEVEVHYFAILGARAKTKKPEEILLEFQDLCSTDQKFRDSIETSTKTIERSYARFKIFEEMINKIFGEKIDAVPVPKPE